MKIYSVTTTLVIALSVLIFGCAKNEPVASPEPEIAETTKVGSTIQPESQEIHFGEIKMLTDGGENAEAYFSFAGDKLIFQSTREPHACDQIFTMNLDGSDQQLVSTGTGRTSTPGKPE